MPARHQKTFRRLLLACVLAAAGAGGLAAEPRDPLRDDVLGATMAGEYALQAGRLDEAIGWYLDAAKAAEGDAGLAERAARLALLGNDDRRAAEALALWRARAPRTLEMRAAEATLAIRRGKQQAAYRELDAMLRDASGRGWRYVVQVLGGSRDQRLAAKLLRRLVAGDAMPDALPAWLVFGDLAYRLDQEALADDILDRIVREAEDAASHAPELRLAIATEYDALGDPRAAERILAQGPQDVRVQAMRASLLARAEDREALEGLYGELKRESNHPDPSQRLLLGQVAEYLGHHAEALDWYRSVPGGGQRWQARLRAASVLHKLGSAGEAYEALRELQNDATADDELRQSAYLLEAELREKDGDAEGEADALARGLAAYPDSAMLLYARGLMWERRDDIARAEADLRRILVVDPDNVAALNALGYTLADRTSRYEEALELIERARIAEPDNAAIIDSYGWVLYRLGRLEEALVELRRAYTMQKDAEIAAHVAEVLWMLGRRDEARRYFDEARRLDPDNRALQRALANTGA